WTCWRSSLLLAPDDERTDLVDGDLVARGHDGGRGTFQHDRRTVEVVAGTKIVPPDQHGRPLRAVEDRRPGLVWKLLARPGRDALGLRLSQVAEGDGAQRDELDGSAEIRVPVAGLVLLGESLRDQLEEVFALRFVNVEHWHC